MKKLQERTPLNIQNAINAYVAAVQKHTEEEFARLYKNLTPPDYVLEVNVKYYKVVRYDPHGSVFCFIDDQGNIYKAASWNAPAKGVRGHVLDEKLPLTGGSLYIR